MRICHETGVAPQLAGGASRPALIDRAIEYIDVISDCMSIHSSQKRPCAMIVGPAVGSQHWLRAHMRSLARTCVWHPRAHVCAHLRAPQPHTHNCAVHARACTNTHAHTCMHACAHTRTHTHRHYHTTCKPSTPPTNLTLRLEGCFTDFRLCSEQPTSPAWHHTDPDACMSVFIRACVYFRLTE